MRTEILMPKLGLTMTQGTVMEWVKKVGDPVIKGEILFTVENDKAVVEVESPADGVLEEILVPAGSTQEVGKAVAYLSAPDDSTHPSTLTGKEKPTAASKRKEERSQAESPPGTKKRGSQEDKYEAPGKRDLKDFQSAYTPASPLVKRLAQENRIDLSTLRGTGPGGAVVERDLSSLVQGKAEPTPAHPSRVFSSQSSSSRKISILQTLSPFQVRAAERMVQSWTTIPQFTLWADVEVDALLSFHRALKERGTPLSFTVLLAKFLAFTLEQYPLLNASWIGGGKVEVFSQVHVGIAVDTPAGLFVPVLRDCGTKPLQSLQEEWEEISSRAKEGKLSPEDIAGGTITLTNLGMFGIKRFQAIVNPPQVAILSVGEVLRRPKEGSPTTFVSMIEFGLSADHRVADGAYGARFLKSFKSALETPLLTLASRA